MACSLRYESKTSNHLKLIDFGFSKVLLGCTGFKRRSLRGRNLVDAGHSYRGLEFCFRWDPNIKMHVSCGTLAYVAPEARSRYS